MTVAIVDYGSGNLHSVAKAFERSVHDAGLADAVLVTADPDAVRAADRVVLPGVGAFADCKAGLAAVPGMIEALTETVLGKELPRIKKLRAAKSLDHYILFSNRRLTGNAESRLREVIVKECGFVEYSVQLCGVEQLELWLKRFPQAADMAEIDPIDSPLNVSPEDLAEIVEHLAKHLENAAVQPLPTDRVSYKEKNELNNMSEDYGKELRRRYLKETRQIKTFLAAPENSALLKQYESAAEEFQLKVLAKRKDYQSFDEVINYLIELLLARDPILRANKRLTRTMLFYMYWNCDIGEVDDAAANQTLTP